MHNSLIKRVKSNHTKCDSQKDNFKRNVPSALGVCFWFDCDFRCDNIWLMNLEFKEETSLRLRVFRTEIKVPVPQEVIISPSLACTFHPWLKT